MVRELIHREAAALRGAVATIREWIHPRKVMKKHEFDRPLDDLGQSIDDIEHRVEMQEKGPKH